MMKFKLFLRLFLGGVTGLVMACACTQEATPLARDSRGVSSLTPPDDAAEKPEDEPEEAPDETIKGYFAIKEFSNCVADYVSFDQGVMSLYSLKPGMDMVVFYDGWLWETNGTDRFDRIDTGEYRVDGNMLYFKGEPYSEVTILENTITLAGKDYTRFTGFKTGSVVEAYQSEAVDLSYEPANCYIVSKPGFYKFKTVKVHYESVGTVARAELLWCSFGTTKMPATTDLISAVWYKDNYVYFAALSSYTYGNAGIAVKDASGKILWSWHIWMSYKYNPEATAQTYYDGTVMMDRNLGATYTTRGSVGNFGLLYQWGRKDPFLGSCSTSEDEAVQAASTGVWNMQEHCHSDPYDSPMTFYAPKSGNVNIFLIDTEGNWGAEDDYWDWGRKPIYDPCPPGWRVPQGGGVYGVWAKSCGKTGYSSCTYDKDTHTNEFQGIFSDASTYYPMTGFLSWEGKLTNVGSQSYCWSCTAVGDDVKAYSLLLYQGHYQAVDKTVMVQGNPVRCCQY